MSDLPKRLPCAMCGQCCRTEPCAMAVHAEHGRFIPGPCRFLERDGKGWGCSLYRTGTRFYRRLWRESNGVGRCTNDAAFGEGEVVGWG